MEVGVTGGPMVNVRCQCHIEATSGDTGNVATLDLRMEGPPALEPPVRTLAVDLENNPSYYIEIQDCLF